METKVGRLKTNAKGKIEFTRKELREYSLEIVNEAIMKSMLACCGYLMDEMRVELIADGMHLPPELLKLCSIFLISWL